MSLRSHHSNATTTLCALMLASSAGAAAAQSLASRVNGAPDGRVEFSFAARPGVCGNGRTFYSSGPGEYTGIVYAVGPIDDGMRAEPCIAGPVRVIIDRADRLPLSVQTFVGPADTTLRGVTDLGSVAPQDAVDYLLSLARTVDGRAGRDALAPAMLANATNTAAGLVDIARNTTLARETRRRALDFMGRSTESMSAVPSSIIEPILAIARDDNDNQSVRQGALSVLARLPHGAGIPPLIQLSQDTQRSWLARQAMQTLASSGDPRARDFLRAAVRRTDLADDILRVALRALGQQYATAQDAALLRDVYPTLQSDASRETVISTLADIGGRDNTSWLLQLAQNANASVAIRRRVISVLSRSDDPRVKQALQDLVIRGG